MFLTGLATLLSAAASAAPELGVRCIERAPLYWRYNVQYANGLPYLAPTHDNQDPNLDQHWPASGETVKFTGQVINHGDQAAANFEFRWKIDGAWYGPVQTYAGTLQPGQTARLTTSWPWPSNLEDHTVTLVVDPLWRIADPYRQNNTYTDYTNALSFSIWVEQGLYDRFNARLNGFGTKSFEDWIRWQFDALRENFARSKYPVIAPNGILERVRIEEINVIPFDPNDLNNWQRYLNNDPHIMLNDGRWQFTSGAQTLQGKIQDWDNYVNTFATQIDGGLMHELAHQLGVIDEYRLNLPFPQANQVVTREGQQLGSMHNFHQAGLMGGAYVADGYDGSYFEAHTAGYLNSNLHYRRGYYGEYLFDTPASVYAQVSDIDGNPLPAARLDFYQKDQNTEYIYNVPTFSGYTDSSGRMLLPNRPVGGGTTTATGHTLRPNPFGKLSVVGQDGTMLVKISWQGQEDFRWMEIIQLNEAFRRGETQTTTIPFKASIFQLGGQIGTQNLALGKPATASSRPDLARYANDGDTGTPGQAWMPNPAKKGQWWQVDLGAVRPISRAVLFPAAGNWHDWFSAFHLEASRTGAFKGEQAEVSLETNWDMARDAGDYGLQRLTGLQNHVVYTFKPVAGRYFRIVSDVDQSWVQLQEARLYPFIAAIGRG